MTRARELVEMDLAFFVNGTLDAPERAELEALMAEDAQLRAEADALAVIRAEMQTEEVRSPGEFGLARLMRDVGREAAKPVAAAPLQNRTWLWQLAAAVAVVGLLAQTLLMRDTGGNGIQLASADAPGALVVTFAPDATEEAIRDMLLGAELEIVAGPSALGLYRLDITEGGDLSAATEALRAAAAIVESVENAQD